MKKRLWRKQHWCSRDLLSPEEKNRLWSKHQTHLKNNATPEEKKEYKEADKVTKGKSNLMWLLKKECPKFLHVTKEVSGEQEASREEKMDFREAHAKTMVQGRAGKPFAKWQDCSQGMPQYMGCVGIL